MHCFFWVRVSNSDILIALPAFISIFDSIGELLYLVKFLNCNHQNRQKISRVIVREAFHALWISRGNACITLMTKFIYLCLHTRIVNMV